MVNLDFPREAYARTRTTRRVAAISAFCMSVAMLGTGLATRDPVVFLLGLWSGIPGAFVTASAVARRRRIDVARRLGLPARLLGVAATLALATFLALTVSPVAAMPAAVLVWLLVYAAVGARMPRTSP